MGSLSHLARSFRPTSGHNSQYSLGKEAGLTFGAALVVVLFGALLLTSDPLFYWADDNQMQHLAARCDIARAWRSGEVPLLSPYSWHCGALAGEYQYAVFSVVEALCVVGVFALDLSLPQTAAMLALLHLGIMAAGAFRLARGRALSPDLALLAALTTCLNGWVIVWAARTWFPALSSLAWLPWFWWGLERAVAVERGPARFVGAGLFLYLIAASGWPFSVLMSGLLVLTSGLKVWRQTGQLRRTWPLAAAAVTGLALSSPAWLMLMEYNAHTLRADVPWQLNIVYTVPVTALFGLVLPAWVSEWCVGTWKPRQSMELVGGLVPTVLLAVAFLRVGWPFVRKHGWELGLLAIVLGLALLPSVGTFRWSFRWLPYLFLLLGILAAHALAELRKSASPQREARASGGEPQELRSPLLRAAGSRTFGPINLGMWALCLVTPVGLAAWAAGMEPPGHVLQHTLWLTGLVVLWAIVERAMDDAGVVRRWMPCGVILGAAWLGFRDVGRFVEFPTWSFDETIRQPGPLDPARRYLSVHELRDMMREDEPRVTNWHQGIGVGLRPGNSWMYSAVPSINGYTPMAPRGLYDVFRFLSHTGWPAADAERVLRHWSAPDGFLDFVGVNGLIVADRYAPQAEELTEHGWQKQAAVEGGALYHRGAAPAPQVRSVVEAWLVEDWDMALCHLRGEDGPHTPVLVRTADDQTESSLLPFAAARVALVRAGRNHVEALVVNESADQEALVVFLRPWFPGYRAWLDDLPLDVTRVDLTMPAVRLPAGARGRLVLAYRPASLVLGCWLAGAALLGIALAHSRLFASRGGESGGSRYPAQS